jgi:hypothetical protein
MKTARSVVAAAAVVGLAAAVLPGGGRAEARLIDGPARHQGNEDISSNWSGYVAAGLGSTATTASSGMTYTDVTGQWVEPRAACAPGSPSSVAIWVGLGGYSESSNDLEQTGTSADCGPNGVPSYYAWYELVPANSVTVKTLKIYPGDVISSAVVIDGSSVLVQVTDRTRKTRFTRHLTMAAPDQTSAEWIVEAPTQCNGGSSCRQLALTNFGSIAFSHSYAIGNGISGTISSPSWIDTALQLVPAGSRFFGSVNGTDQPTGGPGAGTSPLAPDGKGFTVTWQEQPPPASGPTPNVG